MSNRLIALHAALLAAASSSGTAALAQTAERGCIELKTVAEIQEAYVDERGNAATRLVPAAKVVPGDEVIWTIVANNVCTTPAGDVAITNPVPEHMRYVGSSAFGPGAEHRVLARRQHVRRARSARRRRSRRLAPPSARRRVLGDPLGAAAPDGPQRVVDRALSRHRSLVS